MQFIKIKLYINIKVENYALITLSKSQIMYQLYSSTHILF